MWALSRNSYKRGHPAPFLICVGTESSGYRRVCVHLHKVSLIAAANACPAFQRSGLGHRLVASSDAGCARRASAVDDRMRLCRSRDRDRVGLASAPEVDGERTHSLRCACRGNSPGLNTAVQDKWQSEPSIPQGRLVPVGRVRDCIGALHTVLRFRRAS